MMGEFRLPTDDTPILDAALMYAAAGLKTLTIHGLRPDGSCACGAADCSPGKHPTWAAWQRRATADVEATRVNFARHTGNIAVYCDGRFVLVDLDGEEGRRSAEALGELPETLTAETGSGGVHRIYRLQSWQDPSKITDRRIMPGLDIKVRGYFVAAPSLHVSGRRYRWTTAMPPAALTDALYAQVRKQDVPARETPRMGAPSASMKRLRSYVAAMPQAVSGQGGHAATFAVARRVAELPWDDAMELLEEYNDRCDPDDRWTTQQLEHKLRSAKEQGQIVGIEDRPRVEPIRPGVEVPDESWKQHLMFKERKGGTFLAPGPHNQVALLEHDPAWAGRIRLNEFSSQIELTEPPWIKYNATPGVRAWDDTDAKLLQQWYQYAHDLDVSVAACHEAMAVVARKQSYHPVRDWLRGLTWDGVPRLERWLATYLGADDTEYTRSVGKWWLVSAVARVMDPGCKADHMLILEGAQGIGKSTALRVLAGDPWFNDTPLDLTSKDAYQGILGRWIIEFSELASMRRAETEKIKAFCSSPADHYRASYERAAKTHPRQCVFAGTTNHSEYLQDATGNRRFWPVEVRQLALEELRRDRAMLWAEAMSAFSTGAKWYPQNSEAVAMLSAEQEKRTVSDDWAPVIAEYVKQRDRVTTTEILKQALGIPSERLGSRGQGDQKRVAAVLTSLGFLRTRLSVNGVREVQFVREMA